MDDVPRKYQGKQAMWLQDDTYVPFLYKNALCYIVARKPTKEELQNLVVHDITAGNWCPANENQR